MTTSYLLHRVASRRPLLPSLRPPPPRRRSFFSAYRCNVTGRHHESATTDKDGVVVVMGATGTGKSRLSVELSSVFSGEVVNSDKIQVYRGLDVTTNKMPFAERLGVPHHLLGVLDPAAGELPPAGFRALAGLAIRGISSRRCVPVLAGGSNSFVHALLSEAYDPRRDPFRPAPGAGRLRYRCCFLWVHVEAAVLGEHLDRRADKMVGEGMLEELERYFAAEGGGEGERHPGLAKAIGVPELRGYFTGRRRRTAGELEAAVAAIKTNTRLLAAEQVRKIERLAAMGWPLRKVDATAAAAAGELTGKGATAMAWRRDVAGPSAAAVERFLESKDGEASRRCNRTCVAPPSSIVL